METIDEVLADVDSVFCFSLERSYKDRAHGYLERRGVSRGPSDTAVQRVVQDLVDRAAACAPARSEVPPEAADAARRLASMLRDADHVAYGLLQAIG